MPFIRQSETSECGLAAVAMIAGFHGYKTDLPTLRRKHGLGIRGASMKALIDIFSSMGFNAKPYRVEASDINSVETPAILHWEKNHFVVLKHIDQNTVTVLDPASGEIALSNDQFSKRYSGFALEVQPAQSFEAIEDVSDIRLASLGIHLTDYKPLITKLLFFAVIYFVAVLVTPLFIQHVVDDVLAPGQISPLNLIAVAFAAIILIRSVLGAIYTKVSGTLDSALSYDLSCLVFGHLVQLPAEYFDKRNVHLVASSYSAFVDAKVAVLKNLSIRYLNGPLLAVIIVIMTCYSLRLTAAAISILALSFLLQQLAKKSIKETEDSYARQRDKLQSLFRKTITEIEDLKYGNGEQLRIEQWKKQYNLLSVAKNDVVNTAGKTSASHKMLMGLQYLVIVYLASNLVLRQDLSIGMLMAFLAYNEIFIRQAEKFKAGLETAFTLKEHLHKIGDILLTNKENTAADTGTPLSDSFEGKLELSNIHYRYSFNTPDVIKGLSLVVNPGEIIAITGRSGCGKSTLFRIATGLLRPNSGNLSIDEEKLDDIGLANYRSHIGVVKQSDGLLFGSILESIAYLDDKPNEDRVVEVCKLVLLHDEIMEMPLNYQSTISEHGVGLSGGQKQRLQLARALYYKPKILFLDEGTAHLDSSTEALVLKTIKQLGVTCLMITHKQESTQFADRIYSMSDGVVVELKDE